ncbi:MAG: hypothetical protein BGO67_01130 [Alphaproteobacteria bacterium 41-28]|nr:MAG: hypothetical protein BGO67_01130 [Alphaproteobacteria bacterium 41-28]
MLIEIKGKLSPSDLHTVIDLLSSYFQDHGIKEFVEIDIDLKPFSQAVQMPASLSDEKGREIRSIEITKSKTGELKLKEKSLDNSWMTNTLGTESPGGYVMRAWPLYVIGLGLLMLYLGWKEHWFF